MIGIGRHQQALGANLSAWGPDDPLTAVLRCRKRWGVFIKARPLPLGRPRKALNVGQGLDGSGAGIMQRTMYLGGSRSRAGLGCIQKRNRRVARRHLIVAGFKLCHGTGRMGQMQGTVSPWLTGNIILFYQGKNCVRRGGKNSVQVLTGLGPKNFANLIRRKPQARVDQANIPARPAMADGLRLNQGNIGTLPCGLQRRGTAREPTADDRQIGTVIALQMRSAEALVAALRPQRGQAVHGCPRDKNEARMACISNPDRLFGRQGIGPAVQGKRQV